MYKIITDITQLVAINNAAKIIENNPESNYDLGQKHCMIEKYAIFHSSWLQKPEVKQLCSFINDEWLQSDFTEELPKDWTWHYDEIIRIIIPTYLILQEAYLKALIDYCDANEVKYIVDKQSGNSYVYVNYILPQHQAILDMYQEITIEQR